MWCCGGRARANTPAAPADPFDGVAEAPVTATPAKKQVVPESIASSTAANGASADSASTGLPVAAAPALAPAGEAPTAAPVVVAPPAAAEEPVEPSPSDTASPADADATKEAAAVGGAVSGEVPVVPAEVASTEIPAGAGADLAASCVPHAHHTPQHGGAAPAAATATAAGTAAVAAVTAATVVQAEPAAPAAEAVAPAAEPVVPAAPAASGGKVVTINAADLASDAISRSPTHSYTISLTGDFLTWAADGIPLAPAAEGPPGTYAATLPTDLAPGAYHIKFVVDGTVWTTASSLPTVDDGAGNINNLLVVS